MKKFFSLILAIVMCLSIMPMTVSIAADTDVAAIGDTTYATLAAAVSAASAGDTVTLLTDVTENVTIGKSLTIDGANHKYTGNITTNKTSAVIAVKNVNFVDCSDNYAVKSSGAKSMTIENCTATNCSWGLLYANKSTGSINVKNVTIDGAGYGLRISYNNETTLENVTMKNVNYGVYSQTFGKRTFTFKNCTIAANTAPFYAQDKGAKVQTLNFKGVNDFGIDVTTLASDLVKVNADVAKVGTETYATLKEAVAAAADGDTVTVLYDHEIASSQAFLSSYYTGYYVFAETTDKKLTIDLNGKVITINPDLDKMMLAVLFAAGDGEITLKDSSEAQTGAINVTASEATNVYSMFTADEGGKFTIESGNYYINRVDKVRSMLYAGADKTFTVNGGSFVLANALTNTNSAGVAYPWFVNVSGDGIGGIAINAGTFNADPTHHHGEAVYPQCKTPVETDGKWVITVVHTPGAAATCQAAQTCTVCGTELDAIKACAYETYVSDGNATCTKDGTKTAQCIYGCGSTDTVTDEGTAGGHADLDNNGHCDGCSAEICDTCGRVHKDWLSALFCLIVDFVNLVLSFAKSVR